MQSIYLKWCHAHYWILPVVQSWTMPKVLTRGLQRLLPKMFTLMMPSHPSVMSVVTYVYNTCCDLPSGVDSDLCRISFWTLNNNCSKLKKNACFWNHKGTKIRVWASEVKTVSIQPVVSSFCQCYQFRTKSGNPGWTNCNLEFSFLWRIQCSEPTTFVNDMTELEQTLKKIDFKLCLLKFTWDDTPRIQEKNEL